ncbi:MAG: hypothetical protein ACHQ17_07145 [Polyangia bacterium]
MKTRMLLWTILSCALVSGCAHESDIEIRNPLAVHAIDANQIVKPHDYAENARGLPPGSMADQAQLVSMAPAQVCFGVSLHELDPIDLRSVEAELSAPKVDATDDAKVWAEQPTFKQYDGLVPEQRETGTETVCSSRDSDGVCQGWQTRPTYATVYVHGPVKVYETRGRLCFPNHGLATPATEQVSLKLVMRREGGAAVRVGYGLYGGFGGGSKKVVFRWGLSTASGATQTASASSGPSS